MRCLCLSIGALIPYQSQDPTANLVRELAGAQFVDEAAERGLDFRYTFGDDQFGFILEDTGSGVAVIDFDADSWMDLFFVNGRALPGVSKPGAMVDSSSGNRLFRNQGEGRFVDVTDRAGLAGNGYGMGAVVGDYDNDGDEDLYVLNYGPNVFYTNNGDGTFSDRTQELGLAGPERLNGQLKWSVNGVFFDADRDGDLDLYVANYLAFDPSFVDPNLPKEYPYPGPESYPGQSSMLYRNDKGRFVDVTKASGLLQEGGKTMGATVADFDADGDSDLFEAIDSNPNFLFRNDGKGRFTEIATEAGVALNALGAPMASMHGSSGDIDQDGDFDLFVPNLEFGCLYLNEGGMRFADITRRLPLPSGPKGSGWGSAFHDFDHDADLDLLAVLGGAFSLAPGESDRLLLNDGRGTFVDASARSGPYFSQLHVGRGAAFADFDNDGDIDFAVNRKEPGVLPNLAMNQLEKGHHWLMLKLVGTRSNRDAIGARVELGCAGLTQLREVCRSQAYLSQCDVRVHFGLGESTKVDSLRVRWPSGLVQEVPVEAVDRSLRVAEPR